jgi:WD40 repeat protein
MKTKLTLFRRNGIYYSQDSITGKQKSLGTREEAIARKMVEATNEAHRTPNGVHSVWFSPDGKRLAIGSDDKEAVRLCDTESWQDVFTLEAPGTGFGGVSIFPDNNTIAWVNRPRFTAGARRHGRKSTPPRPRKKRRCRSPERRNTSQTLPWLADGNRPPNLADTLDVFRFSGGGPMLFRHEPAT